MNKPKFTITIYDHNKLIVIDHDRSVKISGGNVSMEMSLNTLKHQEFMETGSHEEDLTGERDIKLSVYARSAVIQSMNDSSTDTSEKADAARFRWLLNGQGYYMEENSLCGHPPCNTEEQNDARRNIDDEINS